MLSGTLANINTYLGTAANQPTYTPVANANGTVALTMLTNDGGNSGTGGALIDSDTININIAAVNDAPAFDLDTLSPGSDSTAALCGQGQDSRTGSDRAECNAYRR